MGGKGSGRKPYAACGTRAAYQRHRKRGENCATCKAANTAHYAAKRPRKSRAPGVKKGDVNRQMVRRFKFDAGSCMDCGLVVDDRTIVCFDLDHRDPADKSFTISYVIDKVSPNDLRDELQKCDVVCKNCHALRTHAGKHYLGTVKLCDSHLSLFD